jgi:hypothetical protein
MKDKKKKKKKKVKEFQFKEVTLNAITDNSNIKHD